MTTTARDSGAGSDRLGPYRLIEEIGAGGMGVVHLGLDDRGRGFAVKVLRDHIAHDPQARARLEREVATLQRVDHPRVAPFIGADIAGPRPYLVTRYVSGDPLDVWIERHGRLQGPQLHEVARDLWDALTAIHAAGVVHRDLKPANVLMPSGRPVVIDFGIAHAADDVRLTSTGLVMGTPGYIAPELLEGGEATTATDWWGLAATLAFATTGRPPFGHGPTAAVLDRVRRAEVDLEGVEPATAELLRRALDPDPQARLTGEQIAAALADLDRPRSPSGAGAPAAAATQALSTSTAAPTEAVAMPTAASTETISAPAAAATVAPPGGGASAPSAASAMTSWFSARRPQSRGHESPAPPQGAGAVGDPAPATMVQPRVATRAMPVVPPEHRVDARPGYAGFGAASPPPGVDDPAAHWGAQPPAQPGPSSARPGQPPVHPGATAVSYPPSRSGTLVAIGVLLVVAGALFPLATAIGALVWSLIARLVERCLDSLALKRAERGPRRRDVAAVTLMSPFHAVAAAFGTLFTAVLPALVAVSVYYGATAVLSGQGADPLGHGGVLAGSALAALVVAWWGPGGRALRRGSRSMARVVAPGRWGPKVVVPVVLVTALVLALITQSSGYEPSWWPLAEGFSFSEAVTLPW